MANIDKVKQGLNCCIVRDPDDKMRCTECPYRDPNTYCLNRLKHDALEAIDTLSDMLDALTNVECGESCSIDSSEEV